MALSLAAALPAAVVTSQSRQDGERILDGAIAALGGERFLAMQDRVAGGWLGTWYHNVSRHQRARFYTRYSGGVAEERRAFDKDESYAHLFLTGGAYQITFRGARPLAEDKAEWQRQEMRNNILNILRLRRHEPGLVAERTGSGVCENQSAEFVDISSADERDPVVSVCFSRTTGLPIRQTWRRRDPLTKDRIEETAYFSRYQDAGGGVLWPRHIAYWRDGVQASEMVFDRVEVNPGLAPSLFTVPAAVATAKGSGSAD